MTTLTDDCLELVFSFCGSCPLALCTLAQVCRQWRMVARRPTLWRRLTLDKPSLFKAYQRLFNTSFGPLQAVRHLDIYKPYESRRHKHLKQLTFTFQNVTHLSTTHLCLCEINEFLAQLAQLRSVSCNGVETWCALQPLDMVDLLLTHKHLERLHVRFQDVSGFTSLIAKAFDTATPLLHTLTIINIRDYDYPELTKLLTEMSVRLDGEESMTDVGSRWQALEQRQLAKYGWLSHLKLSHLTFGFCHAWPASVWRQFLVLAPHLDYLELHGWTRLLLYRLHSVAMPVQTEAQLVLIQCFGALTALTRLVLVDFWVTAEMRLPTHSNASICLQYTAEALHKPDALKLLMDVQAFVLVHARHAIQVLFDKSWDRYLTGFNGVL